MYLGLVPTTVAVRQFLEGGCLQPPLVRPFRHLPPRTPSVTERSAPRRLLPPAPVHRDRWRAWYASAARPPRVRARLPLAASSTHRAFPAVLSVKPKKSQRSGKTSLRLGWIEHQTKVLETGRTSRAKRPAVRSSFSQISFSDDLSS